MDLATGGGQVARWIADERPDLAVTGADLADIEGLTPQHERIRWIGGVALERLPFESGAFNALASQFGFEYGVRSPSVSELARVLAHGGQGLIVAHHAGSGMGLNYRKRAEAFQSAIVDLDLIGLARTVFEAHAAKASPSVIAAAEEEFRAAVTEGRARIIDAPRGFEAWSYLRYFRDLATEPRRFKPESALERLKVVKAEAEAWMLRYQAQRDAALDEAGASALVRDLEGAGLVCDEPEVLAGDAGDILAWRVRFSRPD
ncbi:MAG: class I SAM-dependent methyltransferase [Caulobacteraceae bacterium]